MLYILKFKGKSCSQTFGHEAATVKALHEEQISIEFLTYLISNKTEIT